MTILPFSLLDTSQDPQYPIGNRWSGQLLSNVRFSLCDKLSKCRGECFVVCVQYLYCRWWSVPSPAACAVMQRLPILVLLNNLHVQNILELFLTPCGGQLYDTVTSTKMVIWIFSLSFDVLCENNWILKLGRMVIVWNTVNTMASSLTSISLEIDLTIILALHCWLAEE